MDGSPRQIVDLGRWKGCRELQSDLQVEATVAGRRPNRCSPARRIGLAGIHAEIW